MRPTRLLALTLLTSATCGAGVAVADEALYLTPPLYREQARETQQVRRYSEMTTTPQPVAKGAPVTGRTVRIVADVEMTAAR